VELACVNPAEPGEYRVFNQFTESFSVQQLADMVVDAYPGRAEVVHLADPRVEKEDHYYRAAHTKLLDLGLVPHLLDQSTAASILAVAERHRERIDLDAFAPTANWRNTAARAPLGQTAGATSS
ncbi:MAG: NAD-dependent dehydratase, partial [Acidimicrobiales bacterium]